MFFWYICDGEVEQYRGQEANWNNSLVVQAATPEDALIKALHYYRKNLGCKEILHDGKIILAIA